jgi:RHS repeat-associated protein
MNLRYPGQYYDTETGLFYNWNRYYDPSTGRYGRSDPIGLIGALNTFAYVGGNALHYIDYLGLKITCAWVTTRIFDKVTLLQIQPKIVRPFKFCYPVPAPDIGVPAPYSRKVPEFPSPFDISFKIECLKKWIVIQEAKYTSKVEKWMSGYMKCTDSCTGKSTTYWGSDRLASNPPKLE